MQIFYTTVVHGCTQGRKVKRKLLYAFLLFHNATSFLELGYNDNHTRPAKSDSYLAAQSVETILKHIHLHRLGIEAFTDCVSGNDPHTLTAAHIKLVKMEVIVMQSVFQGVLAVFRATNDK